MEGCPMRVGNVPNAVHVRNLCEVASLILQKMETNAATKSVVRDVLRAAADAVNRDRSKKRLISENAGAARANGLHKGQPKDHAVPLAVMLEEIEIKGVKDVDGLIDVVTRFAVVVEISKDEDKRLREAGLKDQMPRDWKEGGDLFARYRHVGIKIANQI
jgi:hypothetical protein